MSDPNFDNGEQRVLTLLRMLSDDVRDHVLSSLSESTRARMEQRLEDPQMRIPSRRRQERILDDFSRMFRCAIQLSRPSLRVHTPDEQHDPPPLPLPEYRLTGDAFHDLEKMNIHQVARAMESEQPRTVALLLQKMTPKRVAEILQQLPDGHRKEIVAQMANSPRTTEALLEKIAQSTVQHAAACSPESSTVVDPILRIADILRETEKPRRRELLESIHERDSEKAATLQLAIYRFDDLIECDDRQVQKVLAQVDSLTLTQALNEASPEMIKKVTRNLSRRAAQSLTEELSYQTPVSPSLRTEARNRIAEAIGAVDQEEL